MSNLDQYFDQSNNITLTQTRDDIINQIKSAPILMKYFPSIEEFAEYNFKGRIDKKNSLSNLLNSLSNSESASTNFAFIEIRGNGACLYNSVLSGLMIQNKGASIKHLLTELVPHDSIALTNQYNAQIINFMLTNYWQIDSALEPFGQQYLVKQFALPLTELSDIALYGFTKSLSEPVQNFQQLGSLISNLFNVVIVLFETQINLSTDHTNDNIECICITPEQITDKKVIQFNISTGLWRVIYVINTSTHYNLVLPHMAETNLLINEANVFFNRIINKIRFV